MRKGFFLLILVCFSKHCFSDDGSWSSSFSLSEGSLYAQTENTDVALESEILAFDGFPGGKTRAVFWFRNTSTRDIEMEAGFPVRVRVDVLADTIPGTTRTGLFLAQGKYEGELRSLEYAKLLLGSSLKKAAFPPDEAPEHSDYYFLSKDVPSRIQLPAQAAAALFDFSILQDGRAVAPDLVVLEASMNRDVLEITFHFHHSLSFEALAASVVRVEYSADYLSGVSNMGSYMQSLYSYSYILGTGRTWKGAIGRLYLSLPIGSDAVLPPSFRRLGRISGRDLFLASEYEPGKADEISLQAETRSEPDPSYLKSLWFDEALQREAPKAPAQSFVIVKGASSSLSSTAPVYTVLGVIPKAGFGPLSLFDGIAETAWSEGAKGDGIGEWVEFQLAEDVEALDVRNGFSMSLTAIEGKSIDTYYEKNNRPKTLEIVSSDGAIKRTIQLADTRELQSFDLVFLPKGTYKLFIRDVYKGSKWQDTCIGEITFVPASPGVKLLKNDSFLEEHMTDVTGSGR